MNRDLALWTGLLAGPAIWLISLETQFALAPWVCAFHWKPAALAVTTLAALSMVGSGLLSWTQLKRLKQQRFQDSRPSAMAVAGLALSSGFLIALLAQAIPQFMMAGCE